MYTYKDLQKGVGRLFSKLRRSSSATSSSVSAEAAAAEREGKAGGNSEIEHVEDANEAGGGRALLVQSRVPREEPEDEDEDDESRGRKRGQQLGFDSSRILTGTPSVEDGESFDSLFSTSTTTGPRTPEDSHIDSNHHAHSVAHAHSIVQGKRVINEEHPAVVY